MTPKILSKTKENAPIILIEISLPLGTFSITEQENPDAYIQRQLAELPDIYRTQNFESIYAVGGSPKQIMKSLKKSQSSKTKLHGYRAAFENVIEHARNIRDAEESTLRSVFNISQSRIPLVPAAARLLIQMEKTFNAETITASRSGFREGVLSRLMEETYPAPAIPERVAS